MVANKKMFRKLALPASFERTKDIFCLGFSKTADAYHIVSINNFSLSVRVVLQQKKLRSDWCLKKIPESQSYDSFTKRKL